jgi:hypothetical protein
MFFRPEVYKCRQGSGKACVTLRESAFYERTMKRFCWAPSYPGASIILRLVSEANQLKRLSIVVLFLVLLACFSCSNLKNTKVTDENKREIMTRIAKGNEITDEDRHLLVEYSTRYSMDTILRGGRPDLPTGKTIGQMIEEQRKWDAEQAKSQGATAPTQPGH